ncbi:MAG TPA: general stress protein [Chloroflexota bacterium]|nr:general stress protein [Chloroflexota bacterium]
MLYRREVAIGVFEDQEDAREAIGALKTAGFAGDDISILMPDRGETRAMAEQTGSHAGEGAATGLVAGGIVGGLGGWLVGIGALAIPGVGPFIAAGALAADLGGAALGAGIGAIAGALIGMGIPEDEAKYYEDEVRAGRTLVAVQAGERLSEADELLHQYGAYDVEHRNEPAMSGNLPIGTLSGDDMPVQRGPDDRADRQAWSDFAPTYQSQWEQRGGTARGVWSDYEPRYRYGWETSNDPRYRGRSWAEVEPELRRDWETRYPQRPWSEAAETVREVWDNATSPVRRRV